MKHKHGQRGQASGRAAQQRSQQRPAQRRDGPRPQYREERSFRRSEERPSRAPNVEYVYGRNATREALRARRRALRRLLIAEGVREGGPIGELLELAQTAKIPVEQIDRRELDALTEGGNHQGVALEAGPYRYAQLDDMLALAQQRDELPLLLLLDHVQDPQNVGTLLRTADVVGVHGVVLPDRRAAGITPSVVNASAGAVEHLLIAQATNLAQTIEELKEQGVWVAGLEDDPRAQIYDSQRSDLPRQLPAPAADPSAQIYDSQRSDLPLALVVGAEGPGLARLVRERCDFLIKLPMAGHVASLNAATAGSIALYSLWRRRSQQA